MEEIQQSMIEFTLSRMVKAALTATIASIASDEEAELRKALTPKASSGVLCESCQHRIPQFELVGNIVAACIQSHLTLERARLGIAVREIAKGATGLVEATTKTGRWREVNVEGEWEPIKILGEHRMIYPAEFSISHVMMLSHQRLISSPVPHLSLAIQDLVQVIVGREEKLLSKCRKDSVKAITIRKSLDSKVMDLYRMGRPDQGWAFETIIGMVEFL